MRVKFYELGFGDGTLAELENAYTKIKSEEKDSKETLEDEVHHLYFRYQKGNGSALDDLKKLASKEEEVSCLAYSTIGAIYAGNRNLDKAKEFFELAKSHCKDEIEKAEKTVSIAAACLRVGKVDEAISYLTNEIDNNSDEKIRVLFYKEIADIFKETNETEKQVLALEKVLEYAPENSNARFDAAFAYGKTDKKHLSLLHYIKYLEFYPNNAAALNNLGVAFSNLKMPIHAISNYEKAAELGNTLASSNIAYKYIEVGFAEKAEEVLKYADRKSDVHPNVAKATVSLSDKREQENKTEKEVVKNAIKQQLFYQNYAGVYYFVENEKVPDLTGNWTVNGGVDTSIIQDGKNLNSIPMTPKYLR